MENEKILSRDEVFLNKLREAVLNKLHNEQFGVTELSEAVAISRFQLHRKLKVLQGKSVSQFIREVRLEEASKMLRADAATASEIAYRVGFSSPSYFNKCFSDFYGYSPGEVKKRNIELVRPGYQQIRVSFDIDSPASREQLEDLVKFAKAHSPVCDSVSNPVNVVVRLA